MKASKYLTVCLGFIALALVFTPACGGGGGGDNLPEIDCAAVVTPTFAEVTIFSTYCTTCHSSQLTGAARFAAPVGVDFDNYDDAVVSAMIAVEAVYAGTMPPTGAPSQQEKDALYAWALCGQPQ